MQIRELASLVAKKEGHRSQSRIGDIREILSILSDLSYDSQEVIHAIVQNGIQRAKRRKKARAKS